MTKTELAKRMAQDAKAFYKQYTAGAGPSTAELNLMTSFGVALVNSPEWKKTIGEIHAGASDAPDQDAD